MRRRRLWAAILVLACVVVVVCLVAPQIRRTWLAWQMLNDLAGPGAQDDAVTVEMLVLPVSASGRTWTVSGRLYRPARARLPLPGFLVCHGAAEAGADDRRQVRFARALARTGCVVFAPELEALKSFRITHETVTELSGAILAAAAHTDLFEEGKLCLFGISLGGSYCLLAAADHAVSRHVSAVVTFGAYCDLEEVLRYWLTEPIETPEGVYPVQAYGKWLALLNNLDLVVGVEADRNLLRQLLDDLIHGREPACSPPEWLSADARRIFEAAIVRGPVEPDLVDEILERSRAVFLPLSPRTRLGDLETPVFLLHAIDDPLVPPSQSCAIASELERSRGAPAELLVTGLFQHVTLAKSGSRWPERVKLVRFAAHILRAAGR